MRGWCAVLLGCGGVGAGPADGGSDACPPGHEQVGPACAPIFDDCGDSEISVLGGGCQRVGLPEDCWPGWLPTEDGGCEPIIPATPCPDGTMEIIGEAECQPIMDCGTGPWGDVDIQSGAIFVDAAYGGGDSDGSEAKPYASIQDAVNEAPPGGQVVVAEGEYVGEVIVDKDLRLDGRCPEMVTIRGVANDSAALFLAEGTSTEVRGVRVTGPLVGILGSHSPAVLLEQVEVVDTGHAGIQLAKVDHATIRQSRVARALAAGLVVDQGTIATIDDVAVGTRPRTPRSGGGTA